jgi:phosphocarrier protein
MIDKEITIINKLGLHARAAAKFVTCANGYLSEVRLKHDGQEVNGKSIMGVMMLAAAQGTVLKLIIEGKDEANASSALDALVADRFGEDE